MTVGEAEEGYRRLIVWQKAHELVQWVYKRTQKFPKEEVYGLTSQIRRAAVSVAANIVEGYARSSKKELLQFLYISYGSLSEVEYYLDLSKDLHYLTREEYEQARLLHREVGGLLHGFILSVKRRI